MKQQRGDPAPSPTRSRTPPCALLHMQCSSHISTFEAGGLDLYFTMLMVVYHVPPYIHPCTCGPLKPGPPTRTKTRSERKHARTGIIVCPPMHRHGWEFGVRWLIYPLAMLIVVHDVPPYFFPRTCSPLPGPPTRTTRAPPIHAQARIRMPSHAHTWLGIWGLMEGQRQKWPIH